MSLSDVINWAELAHALWLIALGLALGLLGAAIWFHWMRGHVILKITARDAIGRPKAAEIYYVEDASAFEEGDELVGASVPLRALDGKR